MSDITPTRDHAVKPETPAEAMDEKIDDLPSKPVADLDAESVAGGAVDSYMYFKTQPSSSDVQRAWA